MPKFTEEQQLAIDMEGTNILVSAGAGSGKTAVLTERVLRKLKEGTHINELLILTFTNKAALEMKERVRKKLKENELIEELDLLDSSYITTFDAYSLALVKKYADTIHLSSNITIAESSILDLAKKEILDEIFLDYYDKCPNDFLNLITKFCLKDDKTIKKRILELDSTLDLKLNKAKFIDTYIAKYYSDEVIDKYIKEYLELLGKKKENIIDLYEEVRSLTSSKYLEQLESMFLPFVNATSYEELKRTIFTSLPRARTGVDSDSKELRDNLTSIDDLYPLSYLIDTIKKYDADFKITYYGNITEQDYQGTFTDIICTIDSSFIETCTISSINDNVSNNVIADETLRGWTEDGVFIGPEDYDLMPKFEDEVNQQYDSVNKNLLTKIKSTENIEFNVLIPLFNMVSTDGETEYYDDSEEISDTHNHNVPLGIWFADSQITVNTNSKYGQSWSLVIGSQFKPLPTSQKSYSDISKTSNADAYATFAQVLTRQNELLDSFYSINTDIKELENKVNTIESGLSIGVDDETLVIGKKLNI